MNTHDFTSQGEESDWFNWAGVIHAYPVSRWGRITRSGDPISMRNNGWCTTNKCMYQTPIPALTSISSEITRFPDILQLPWSMGFIAKIKWNFKKSSAFIQKTVAPASYCTQQKLQPFSHVPLSSRQPIWMFCHEGVLMNVGLASSHDLALSVSSVPIPQR